MFLQNMLDYLRENIGMIGTLTLQHIQISMSAVLIALLIGVPVAILLYRFKEISSIVLNLINILYTIPSLALFGLMIPIIGMGETPALIALIVYSLLPIVQNTYVGIKSIDQNIIEAAVGMGMNKNQILLKIELPLAMSVILAGLRTALVNSIGIATIASQIGAGGLGVLVYRGMTSVSPIIIIIGSVPIIMLAVTGDYILKMMEERLSVS